MPTLLGTVASAYVDETVATPTFILEDDWTDTNGDPWDSTKWPRLIGSPTVQSNAGEFSGAGTAVTEVTARDFELLVKVTANTPASKFAEIGWRVSQNVVSGTPESGYVIQCNGSDVNLHKVSSYSTVATAGSSGLNASGTFWFRINVVGTTHKVRWWADGAGEPGTWQINTTDSTYTGGRLMLRSYGGAVTWDDLEVIDLGVTGNIAARTQETFGAKMTTSASAIAGSDFTICAWFRYETASTQLGIVEFQSGGNLFQLGISNTGNAQISRSTGGDHTIGAASINSWYFAAVSHVASTGINTCRLFPDGGSVTATTSSTGVGLPSSATCYVNGSAATDWAGSIAAVKIWTAALSTSEMDAERNSYAAVRTSNLWAEYQLNVDPLNVDTSGNARTLTFTARVPHRAAGPVTPT